MCQFFQMWRLFYTPALSPLWAFKFAFILVVVISIIISLLLLDILPHPLPTISNIVFLKNLINLLSLGAIIFYPFSCIREPFFSFLVLFIFIMEKKKPFLFLLISFSRCNSTWLLATLTFSLHILFFKKKFPLQISTSFPHTPTQPFLQALCLILIFLGGFQVRSLSLTKMLSVVIHIVQNGFSICDIEIPCMFHSQCYVLFRQPNSSTYFTLSLLLKLRALVNNLLLFIL